MVTEEDRRRAFRTQRLALRCVAMEDASVLHGMFDDPKVLEYLSPKDTMSLDEMSNRIADRLEHGHLYLAIHVLPESEHISTPQGMSSHDVSLDFPPITVSDVGGTMIGSIGLSHKYQVGYAIGSKYWSKGYASEAFAGIMREICTGAAQGKWGDLPCEGPDTGRNSGHQYVMSTVFPDNTASLRVLEKNEAMPTVSIDVEDWSQTPEDRERNGPKIVTLLSYKIRIPEQRLEEKVGW